MFQHLVTRAEIIEARIAKYMGKKADAIQARYNGRRGEYLSIAFGLMYYFASSILLPIIATALIFLYLLLRYVIPVIYVFLCVASLASISSYLITSNSIWATENFNSLALLFMRPFFSNQAIVLIYIIIPVLLVAAIFISLATAIAILYRKAVFADVSEEVS